MPWRDIIFTAEGVILPPSWPAWTTAKKVPPSRPARLDTDDGGEPAPTPASKAAGIFRSFSSDRLVPPSRLPQNNERTKPPAETASGTARTLLGGTAAAAALASPAPEASSQLGFRHRTLHARNAGAEHAEDDRNSHHLVLVLALRLAVYLRSGFTLLHRGFPVVRRTPFRNAGAQHADEREAPTRSQPDTRVYEP